jgi:hypothetical protein
MVGYKDKNIASCVKAIKAATTSENFIYVFDQHPIDHKKDFIDIDGCEYEHRIWDDMAGPAAARWRLVHNNLDNFSYVCVVSPDITLASGWDTELIGLLEDEDVVFSGSGKVIVEQKDLFSITSSYQDSNRFSVSQVIDRNFIFAKSEAFGEILLPDFLKYAGENEYLTVSFLSKEYTIVSVPSRIYSDSRARSVENTYHTFSLEHNYNTVVDILHSKNLEKYKISPQGVSRFLDFHKINPDSLKRLPYSADDVLYDPYDLKMHGVDARRFIAGTKAVY